MDVSPRSDSWFSGTGFPNRLFDVERDDYELYEADGDRPGQRGTYHHRFRFPKRVDALFAVATVAIPAQCEREQIARTTTDAYASSSSRS